MIHELKTSPKYFRQVWVGAKTFEFRINDRDFQIADTVLLQEWCPDAADYTGREIEGMITYILKPETLVDVIPPGYCIFSFRETRRSE